MSNNFSSDEVSQTIINANKKIAYWHGFPEYFMKFIVRSSNVFFLESGIGFHLVISYLQNWIFLHGSNQEASLDLQSSFPIKCNTFLNIN